MERERETERQTERERERERDDGERQKKEKERATKRPHMLRWCGSVIVCVCVRVCAFVSVYFPPSKKAWCI